MNSTALLHELIMASAERAPDTVAVTSAGRGTTYEDLAKRVRAFASAMRSLGVERGERIGVYLDKRVETVVSFFGSSAAGAVFVPINPVLKAEQVEYILRNCNVRVLVTTADRLAAIASKLAGATDLRHVLVVDGGADVPAAAKAPVHRFDAALEAAPAQGHRVIDADMAAIFYTSGSTGMPKGVVLSHRNMVIGAKSVASYLENSAADTLLAALPLSFDAGFSQLTTAFHSGARVVLLNYLVPRDVIKSLRDEGVTGLTAVPPLWIQLADVEWPESIGERLRYFANTGGRMPLETLKKLRAKVPRAKPYLMYGLTEAFRATYLPPDQAAVRPDSIGVAIPNSEVLVLREDGSICAPNEPGELVQRGALVALGYWNNPEATAERFKPLPSRLAQRPAGLMLPEIAVFSGDTVRRDEEGYLYFIGRRDEMIKTSGYRVSPAEVEEILYSTGLVGECAAFGLPHEKLGQSIHAIVAPPGGGAIDADALLAECKRRMPAYMVPAALHVRPGPLPRSPNGKIDRKLLAGTLTAEGGKL